VHNPGPIPSDKVAIRRIVRAGNAAAAMGKPDRTSLRQREFEVGDCMRLNPNFSLRRAPDSRCPIMTTPRESIGGKS
jgi:hypothetical protein